MSNREAHASAVSLLLLFAGCMCLLEFSAQIHIDSGGPDPSWDGLFTQFLQSDPFSNSVAAFESYAHEHETRPFYIAIGPAAPLLVGLTSLLAAFGVRKQHRGMEATGLLCLAFIVFWPQPIAHGWFASSILVLTMGCIYAGWMLYEPGEPNAAPDE